MRETTDSRFDQDVLASQKPVLVDVWAPWCGPCRALAPWLGEVETHFQGELEVVKVNLDDNPAIGQRFAVRSLPTLLLFRGGRLLGRSGNPGSAQAMAHFVASHLQ